MLGASARRQREKYRDGEGQQERDGEGVLGEHWEQLRIESAQEAVRGSSGQGSGLKAGLMDLPACYPKQMKFRCGF